MQLGQGYQISHIENNENELLSSAYKYQSKLHFQISQPRGGHRANYSFAFY